jgi:2-polyprenyl-3-methyl-5-hydroxy-6-metoxy-1,4-benzoquinol methylase
MNKSVQHHVNCPLCNANDFKVIHHFKPNYYNHQYYTTPSWDGGVEVSLTIVKCKACGFKYQNPIFNDESLYLLYPESDIPKELNPENYNRNFSAIWNLLKPYQSAAKEKMFALDIGTRYGALPKFLQDQGMMAVGLEMNQACVNAAINYGFKDIFCGKIDSIPDVLSKYNRKDVDVILMVDVIEHLTNPSMDFRLIASAQKPGQILLLTTMFDDSVGGLLFGKEWYYIHGQHTMYFSRKTITQFLAKQGYEVVTIDIIPLYNSFVHFPKEFLKLVKHKWHLFMKTKFEPKKWFADDRPHCLDLMNVVAIKK